MLKISHNIWWIPPVVFYDFLEGYPPSPQLSRGQGTVENDRRRPWRRGFGNPTSTVERRDALIHIVGCTPVGVATGDAPMGGGHPIFGRFYGG